MCNVLLTVGAFVVAAGFSAAKIAGGSLDTLGVYEAVGITVMFAGFLSLGRFGRSTGRAGQVVTGAERRVHAVPCTRPRKPERARGPDTEENAVTDLAVRSGESAGVWRERDAELISPAYSRYTDLVVDHALGAHLYTVDGRDVLDFGCGIGVTNLGHLHPAVVKAVHEQVDRLWHTSVTTLNPA